MGYVYLTLLARWEGAAAVGVFSICYTTVQIASMAGRLNLEHAVVKFFAPLYQRASRRILVPFLARIYGFALPGMLALGGLLYALSSWLAEEVFQSQSLVAGLRWSALLVPVLGWLVMTADTLRTMGQALAYALCQFFLPFALASALLWPVLRFLEWETGFLLAWGLALVGTLFMAVVWLVYAFRNAHEQDLQQHEEVMPVRALEPPSSARILKMGYFLLPGSLAAYLINWTDTLMLGIWRPESEVGVYSVAMRLSLIVGMGLMAAGPMAAPQYAQQFHRGDFSEMEALGRRTTRLALMLALGPFMILMIGGGWLLEFFGAGFDIGRTALIILLCGQLAQVYCGGVGYLMQMAGLEKAYRNVVLVGVFLNAILNAWMIPWLGMEGAAMASATTLASWNSLAVWMVYRRLGIAMTWWPGLSRS